MTDRGGMTDAWKTDAWKTDARGVADAGGV